MFKSVEGIYANGKVELLESLPDLAKSRVIVTFLPGDQLRLLSDLGIDKAQAADLRARLSTFEEDWNRPDMDGYDAL